MKLEKTDLKNTIDLMMSDNYKDRLVAEYWQTRIRFGKLCDMLEKWTDNELDYIPPCPRYVYIAQERAMADYLDCLWDRAHREGISLYEK